MLRLTLIEKDIFFDFILKNEGFYSFDADDPGGETFVGITRKYFKDWSGWEIVDENKNKKYFNKTYFDKNLKLKLLVIEFYEEQFFKKYQLYFIKNFLKQLLIIDFIINAGYNAVKSLKEEFSTENNKDYLEIINNYEIDKFILKYKIVRIGYYAKITKRNKKFKKYILGWVLRTLNSDKNILDIFKKYNYEISYPKIEDNSEIIKNDKIIENKTENKTEGKVENKTNEELNLKKIINIIIDIFKK